MSTPSHDSVSHDSVSHDSVSHAAPSPTSGGTARRVFVLAVALAMMTGLAALRAESAGGVADPLTLAAIGFVLLAAFTVGELGAALGLPKVTGYIVAGVALGPQVADILSDRVVGDMGIFNTLALGLIATTAGLELHLPAIRKVGRTLAATVGLKILLLPVFVGLPLALFEHLLPSFGLSGWGPVVALALVISVLGIGTSPAIALAVVNDSGSRGRLTDLLLGIAVVKDLVVVTCLAIAIAVARSLLGGGAMDASVLSHLGMELGGSVLVGAAVGGLLILYFRFIRVEPLFSVLVTILLVAELAHFLHLELLLVFITAGFLVRNFSSFEHELLHPLEKISLPVFVVFFTTAGAGVDLRGTLTILPLAIGLVLLRAAAYFVAGRLGGKLGGEQPAVGDNAWLTYLPQAGVTLGLVLLAAKALPELDQAITRLGLALVTLNLLVGPVTLALGLQRAGETAAARARAGADAAAAVGQGAQLHAQVEAGEGGPVESGGLPSVTSLAARLEETALAGLVAQVGGELDARLIRYLEESLDPLSEALSERVVAVLPQDAELRQRVRQARQAASAPASLSGGAIEGAAALLFDDLADILRAAPWQLSVPMAEDLLEAQPGEGRAAALRRALGRLSARGARLRGRTPQRAVPAQLALRCSLEPRLSEALVVVAAGLHRADAQLLALARRGLQQQDPVALDVGQAVVRRWRALAEADLRRALLGGLEGAVGQLAVVGSPTSPASELRFADVESRVAAALSHLADDGPAWAEARAHAEDGLRAAAFAATSGRVLATAIEQRARLPLRGARSEILPELEAVALRLDELAAEGEALDEAGLQGEGVERLGVLCTDALTRSVAVGLRRAAVRFRRRSQPGLLVRDIAEIVRNTPERASVVAGQTPLERANRPGEVEIRELPLARMVDAQLHDDLLPAISGALGPVAELVAACEGRVREGASVAGYGAHLAARGGFETTAERRAVLVDAIRRGERRIRRLHDELVAALDAADAALQAAEQRSVHHLHELLEVEGSHSGTLVRHTLRATLQGASEGLRQLRDEVGVQIGRLVDRARALAQDKNVRDLRIRSGLEPMDATAIRAYVDANLGSTEGRGLPPAYARLMAPAPVSERRMFVGRDALLARLLDGLSERPTEPAPSTLVVGSEGSGCSSLLQMVQMQLAGPRVIWLDPAFAARADGPVGALATELGVVAEPSLVREALQARPTVVLIDAVEAWLEPSGDGLDDLAGLMELVAASSARVRWLLSMSEGAFAVYDEALGLRSRLARFVLLSPLDGASLQDLVERRARQGGFDAVYGAGSLRDRVRERIRPGREKEDYFRALARAARGIPGDALRIHLASVRGADAHTLRFGPPTLPQLPFVPLLPAEILALLSVLLQFGPLDPARLARVIGQSEATIASHLGFLLHAGLIHLHGQAGAVVAVHPVVGPSLRRELEEMAIVSRGAP